MPQKKAHGSKTLSDLSPVEVSQLYRTILSRSKAENSGLAIKYGLSLDEVRLINSRLRNSLQKVS